MLNSCLPHPRMLPYKHTGLKCELSQKRVSQRIGLPASVRSPVAAEEAALNAGLDYLMHLGSVGNVPTRRP